MFKLDPNPTFRAVVPISVPGGDSIKINVVFRHMKRTPLAEFINSYVTRAVLQNLQAMVESVDEKPSDMSLDQFLADLAENYPASSRDVLNVFVDQLTESRAKN